MSNSSLVNYTKLSPNYSERGSRIKKITIHHMAGNLTVETCGNVFAPKSAQASSNYGIGTDGRVGLYVDESNRPWTSSSCDNDSQAVTIEVANDEIGGNWHVSDKALNKLIQLCTDICRRNGIARLNFTGDKNGNLTMHKMFIATNCPGPYLESKYSFIANEVNKVLSGDSSTNIPTPNPQPPASNGDYLFLNAHVSKWNVYPTNVAPVIGNQCGSLSPSQFGGLEYKILGNPQTDVYTIQTESFGKVNIYVPKDRDSKFYNKNITVTPPKPIPPVINKRYLNIHKHNATWRVYPLNKPAIVGNEVGKLSPAQFGGLSYEILEDKGNIKIIQTQSFGKVQIFAPQDADSSITAIPIY